jgi:hypothetical protein
VNRVKDARRMLSLGSSAFDVSARGTVTEFEPDGVRINVTQPEEAAGLRPVLVREIEAAEARLSGAE